MFERAILVSLTVLDELMSRCHVQKDIWSLLEISSYWEKNGCWGGVLNVCKQQNAVIDKSENFLRSLRCMNVCEE